MKNTIVVAVLVMPGFLASVYGQPLDIAVSDAQYTTYVEAYGSIGGSSTQDLQYQRTTTSSVPINDEIDVTFYEPLAPSFYTSCKSIASAGLFSDSSSAGWGIANASATSQLWFSPLEDQSQMVTITYDDTSARGDLGSLSLVDLTTGSELWNFGWSFSFANSVTPGDEFELETTFVASDQYELTMNVQTSAGHDSDSNQIQLAGLQVVPEPATVGFAVVCGLCIANDFRRRRNISRSDGF
jgi:hypothetical protein